MKSKAGMMMAMAGMMAAMAYGDNNKHLGRENLIGESEEAKQRRRHRNTPSLNKAKGLKEFFYGSNSVWAINQKNADRKARLQNWL